MIIIKRKEESRLKGSGSPYNKRIELTVRGRHVFRLRESRAGDPLGLYLYLPLQALRPCSQLIRALGSQTDRLLQVMNGQQLIPSIGRYNLWNFNLLNQ